MSGNWQLANSRAEFEELYGDVPDAEISALIHDLCAYGRFETQDEAGPLMAYEYVRSGDWAPEVFDEACARFKVKWLHKMPQDRADFYAGLMQQTCDKYKRELLEGIHEWPEEEQ